MSTRRWRSVYLFLPIAVMIVFSFNDPRGRQNITWQGFTIENYFDVWSRPDITGPMINSLIIAVVATVVATILGHAHRPGPDALPVPRPRPAQPADLHPDGHAGGDHGRVAAVAVGVGRRRSAASRRSSSPTSCSASASSWSPFGRASPASTARSKRPRWTSAPTSGRRSAR